MRIEEEEKEWVGGVEGKEEVEQEQEKHSKNENRRSLARTRLTRSRKRGQTESLVYVRYEAINKIMNL